MTKSLVFHRCACIALLADVGLILSTMWVLAPPVLAQPAATESTDGVPRATVRYRGADLETDAGARALLNKIRYAARTVCHWSEFDSRDLAASAWARTCVDQATIRAVSSVNSARLTALLEKESPRRWPLTGSISSTNALGMALESAER